MIVGLIISGIVIIGTGLLIREQLNRQDKRIDVQDKRIDTLLKYIKPEVYRKNKYSDNPLPFRGEKKEPHDAVAEALSRGGG